MNRLPLAFAASISVSVLAACPGSEEDPGGANPDKLYLALDGSEVQVKLIGLEPPPY